MGYIQHPTPGNTARFPNSSPVGSLYSDMYHRTAHIPVFGGRRGFTLHGLLHALFTQLFGAIAPATTDSCPVAPSGSRLPYAVAINGQSTGAVAAEFAEEIGEEGPASGARGRDVDDRVPEAHEGKDDACRVCVGNGDGLGVDERVDAVDGRGHPGDEQGDEEEGGHLGVTESRSVGFLGCPALPLLLVFHAGLVLHRRPRRR